MRRSHRATAGWLVLPLGALSLGAAGCAQLHGLKMDNRVAFEWAYGGSDRDDVHLIRFDFQNWDSTPGTFWVSSICVSKIDAHDEQGRPTPLVEIALVPVKGGRMLGGAVRVDHEDAREVTVAMVVDMDTRCHGRDDCAAFNIRCRAVRDQTTGEWVIGPADAECQGVN